MAMPYHYSLRKTHVRVRFDQGPVLSGLPNLLRTLSPRNKMKVCRRNKTQLTHIQNKCKVAKNSWQWWDSNPRQRYNCCRKRSHLYLSATLSCHPWHFVWTCRPLDHGIESNFSSPRVNLVTGQVIPEMKGASMDIHKWHVSKADGVNNISFFYIISLYPFLSLRSGIDATFTYSQRDIIDVKEAKHRMIKSKWKKSLIDATKLANIPFWNHLGITFHYRYHLSRHQIDPQ